MYEYDFPLTPKARTYLKFEAVFKRVEECRSLANEAETMSFMRGIIDFMDLIDGTGALKIDISKDLERLDSRLKFWSEDQDADTDLIAELRDAIAKSHESLNNFTRQRTVLRDDPIISSIKPRFLTPCGINSFDTPLFVLWSRLPFEDRKAEVDKWLYELDTIRTPLDTILYIWRLCADFQKRVAYKGFMKESGDNCDFIAIRYPKRVRGYPVVSGFQSSINVRFLPYEKGAEVGDIEFDIAFVRGNLA